MSGPRDWSQAGYWDEPATTHPQPHPTERSGRTSRTGRTRPTGWWMAVALLLGVFAVVWPLGMSSASPSGVGWAVTSVGVSAVSIALWYRHAGGGTVLPSIAATLGFLGSILCIWSVAATGLPGTIPALPSAFGIPAAAHGGASGDAGAGAPACRVESPEPVALAEASSAEQQRSDAVQGAVAVLADAVCVQAAGGAYPTVSDESGLPSGTVEFR